MNISIWLKDHLGLLHMSEADLNSLMFNPRHGSLCRRLVDFLAKSTLCSQKYPNVYAHEERIEAERTLEDLTFSLKEVLKDLSYYGNESENEERNLCFLKLKLDHLQQIQAKQRPTLRALEEMASSPNLVIEQIGRNISEADYLSNSDLQAIYSEPEKLKLETSVPERQVMMIDEELRDLREKTDILHVAVAKTLTSVHTKLDQILPSRTKMDIVMKPLKYEEILVDAEEKVLEEDRRNLLAKYSQLNQEVLELSEQYKFKKQSLDKFYKEKLEAYLKSLKDLINL